MGDWFRRFSERMAHAVGTPAAFIIAVVALLVWALTGPLFGFSDTWQLIINTSTTIITFLMVFLIQNTQNRDAAALHVKLDELLRSVKTARTAIADVEEKSEGDLIRLRRHYLDLAHEDEARETRRAEKGVPTRAKRRPKQSGSRARRRERRGTAATRSAGPARAGSPGDQGPVPS